MDKLRKMLRTLRREALRPLLMAIAAAALLWLANWLPSAAGEVALAPLFTSAGVVMGLVSLSHVTRRVFFPRLDVQTIALKAVGEANVAAALVFLGVCLILAVLIAANVAMLS